VAMPSMLSPPKVRVIHLYVTSFCFYKGEERRMRQMARFHAYRIFGVPKIIEAFRNGL
jgi:hypothetical protein